MSSTAFHQLKRMPGREAFAHGTRARYVAGCRCNACRHANVVLYHQRQALGIAAAAEISGPAVPVGQTWTAPDGSKRVRFYKRACPGAHNRGCPLKAHLRKDSKGGVCRSCRGRLIWNGCVSAAPVRAHLRRLSALGVGRRAVAAASDVTETVIFNLTSGRSQQCRKATADRILAVTRNQVSDHALVPAGPTWRRLEALLGEGFSKAELARRLGKLRSIQFRKTRITALNASKVERLYRTVMEVPA